MLTLLVTVFVASLLGSFHCVCMCGPIAIWSSGSGTNATCHRSEIAKRILGYHVGRLLTYLLLGSIAGMAGKTLGLLGESVGLQSTAARLAGTTLVGLGVWRLYRLVFVAPKSTSNVVSLSWTKRTTNQIAWMIAQCRPHLAKLPTLPRSIGVGAVTVLLPCGWLYLFVLFAAGSGSVLSAIGVMTAFWLGTVPALVALVAGTLRLQMTSGHWLPRLMPTLGALALIGFGLHTAAGRASADMQQWERRVLRMIANSDTTRPMIEQLQEQPLPCCQHAH